MRLQQQRIVIDRVAHRHRDLHLPVARAVLDDGVEDFAQIRLGQRVDLRVHAWLEARPRWRSAARAARDRSFRSRHAGGRESPAVPSIETPRVPSPASIAAADALLGQRPRAALDAAMDAGVARSP